jgi:hypothetical protein
VREFDERCGWQKWGFGSCAEWLAWRCDLSLSAARENVRTAIALREMPAISSAFEDGRLSYSKVRALTRVAEYHDEESLLDYALRVTVRRSRNAAARFVTRRQSRLEPHGALGSNGRSSSRVIRVAGR